MTVQNKASPSADDRLDLVRRLFAIAISIGLANTIVNATWLREGHAPNSHDMEQIFIVLLALFATVLSWEGYLSSVRKKPLNDWPRFTIDVFLVFIYMILFITSNKSWFWLPIMCSMYGLYVIWDAISVLEYPATFDQTYPSAGRLRFSTLSRVYYRAVLNDRDIDRGPLISLLWTAYFVGLWRFIWDLYAGYPVIPAVLLGATGLGGYRLDKWLIRDGLRGFTMLERMLLIVALVAAAFLFAHLSGIPRKV